jgi:hypothetical protein
MPTPQDFDGSASQCCASISISIGTCVGNREIGIGGNRIKYGRGGISTGSGASGSSGSGASGSSGST